MNKPQEDPKLVGGTATVAFGQTLESHPIPRLMLRRKGETVYVLLLGPDVIAVKYHYLKDIGRILCTDGLCCDADPRGAPPVRYVLPVMQLNTEIKGGKIVPTNTGKAKCLLLSGAAYEDVISLVGPHSPKGVILKVVCLDPDYQQMDITLEPDKFSSEKHLDVACSFVKENMDCILPQFGKSMPEETLASLMGLGASADSDIDPQKDPLPI